MKIYNKYSRFHKNEYEPIHTQYTSKDEYQRRQITLPKYVNKELERITNISGYISELIIKDLQLRKPVTDSQREQWKKEMVDFI
jgi:hypothetical protein